MAAKRILTVFGATGNQGGSIISTVHRSPTLNSKYQIRAVTRDTTKPASQSLANAGAELVQADLSDVASIQKAVAGSYAVFGVTDFWNLLNQEAEEKQGQAIADASIAAGVKHLIWSSLPHGGKMSNGKITKLHHFDGKANVEQYIESKKSGSGMAASYYMPAVFMQNLLTSIQKGPDGVLAWATPMTPEVNIPFLDIKADTGKWVVGLLEAGPEKADGVRVQAVGEWASPSEAMDKIGKVVGVKYEYKEIPRDVFKSFMPEVLAEELTETMEIMGQYQYYGIGSDKNQAESDKWFLEGAMRTSLEEFAKNNPSLPK